MTDPSIQKFTPPNDTRGIPADPAKKRSGCGLGCGIVILAIIAIGVIVGVSSCVQGNKPYDPNNAAEVTAQCEAQVSAKLKAPSTAKFSNESATGSGTWTVTGTVDSQNSFGAMLRSQFQCTVTVDGETVRTRVDTLG